LVWAVECHGEQRMRQLSLAAAKSTWDVRMYNSERTSARRVKAGRCSLHSSVNFNRTGRIEVWAGARAEMRLADASRGWQTKSRTHITARRWLAGGGVAL
jgi:hypothetical protein